MHLPILSELDSARNVLVAGAGGGFDIFNGLPLYFSLLNQGKNVYLANYTFSQIRSARRITPNLVEVNRDSTSRTNYFPEKYLAEWLDSTYNSDTSIFCFDNGPGCQRLFEAYQILVDELSIDTVILADGGSDSLLTGDENGLGTPVEDMTSVAAVHMLDNVENKILISLGFGVDRFHGVCHAQVLESMAALMEENAFLGAFALSSDMPEVEMFKEASEFVFDRMPHNVSIVISSILSALEGKYGNIHATSRTFGNELWINPLMTILWCFSLCEVADRVIYLPQLKKTETLNQVAWEILKFRFGRKKKSWFPMPI